MYIYSYVCKFFIFDDTSKIPLIIFNKTFPQNILQFGFKFITLQRVVKTHPKKQPKRNG